MSTTKKILLSSDGKSKMVESTRELDDVFAFLREKSGEAAPLYLCLTNDQRGGNIYNLRRNPAVWCVCYPENHPLAKQLAEIFGELHDLSPELPASSPEDHR